MFPNILMDCNIECILGKIRRRTSNSGEAAIQTLLKAWMNMGIKLYSRITKYASL